MTDRVMIVLGGNAFVKPGEQLTMAGQFQFAQSVLTRLEPLLAEPAQAVVTHGNGPQVGHILIRVEEALGKAYAIPLEVCVAESEGELGYVLEQSLYKVASLTCEGRIQCEPCCYPESFRSMKSTHRWNWLICRSPCRNRVKC